MKRKSPWPILLACLLVALSPLVVYSIAIVQEESDGALADVSLCWANYSFGDSVSNLPVTWSKQWYFRIVNTPDKNHLPITNPNVTIETDLELVGLYPPPTVSHPPFHQWVHRGTIAENYWFLAGGFEDGKQTHPPGFSLSRVVWPERLRNAEINQTVKVTFRLEETLPPEVNEVAVTAGFYPITSEHPLAQKLVDYEVLEWISPEGWEIYRHGVSALQWTIYNTSQIAINETYEFNATFRVVKSQHLEGSPLSKPSVGVICRRFDVEHHGRCESATVDHPEGVIATFQADEELSWTSMISSSYHHFSLMGYATSIIGDEPPFHALSDLIFTLHSCADLHIYDGMGRHAGLNYETNEIETLIPGASFDVINGDQISKINDPQPGNYSVVLIGTSSGPYELTVEGATETETFYTETIPGVIEPGGRREMGVSVPEKVGRIAVNELPAFCIILVLILTALSNWLYGRRTVPADLDVHLCLDMTAILPAEGKWSLNQSWIWRRLQGVPSS